MAQATELERPQGCVSGAANRQRGGFTSGSLGARNRKLIIILEARYGSNRAAYFGVWSPGDKSHSCMWDLVSACRALWISWRNTGWGVLRFFA